MPHSASAAKAESQRVSVRARAWACRDTTHRRDEEKRSEGSRVDRDGAVVRHLAHALVPWAAQAVSLALDLHRALRKNPTTLCLQITLDLRLTHVVFTPLALRGPHSRLLPPCTRARLGGSCLLESAALGKRDSRCERVTPALALRADPHMHKTQSGEACAALTVIIYLSQAP